MKVYDVPGLDTTVITQVAGERALLLADDLTADERVAAMLNAMTDLDAPA